MVRNYKTFPKFFPGGFLFHVIFESLKISAERLKHRDKFNIVSLKNIPVYENITAIDFYAFLQNKAQVQLFKEGHIWWELEMELPGHQGSQDTGCRHLEWHHQSRWVSNQRAEIRKICFLTSSGRNDPITFVIDVLISINLWNTFLVFATIQFFCTVDIFKVKRSNV